jgi:nicotinate-nucleotide--dimethylbenzimidazole phosphoribosyltransferase
MNIMHIPSLNLQLTSELQNKINQKTKPIGALGALETLALQIGLIQNTVKPKLIKPTMLVFAGDHGIVSEGVSPFPQAVTAQMVLNFLAGGAAINVFARQNGFDLWLVDSGVNYDFELATHLIHAKVGMGTRNFLYEPAMSEKECEQALTSGIKIAQRAMADECNVFGFGEMGIGNTSSASCLMSVLCGESLRACVGRGTGLDEIGLANKIDVLQRALDHHQPMKTNPIAVLATFGGFEIAMMTGAMLGAAQGGAVLLIDGFIATSALLVAAKIQPNILQYCVFSHCSDELGHKLMLEHLQAKPLLNLGLRLGEGTGAALAYPIVQAAVNFLNDMASFQSAGISNKSEI